MVEGGRAAAALWARTDLRSRWRSLVILGVLVGITAGLAMAAFAGARRTATALERLRVATNAPDAVVFPGQVGTAHPDWAPLRAQPEVRSLAVWDLLFGTLAGEPGALLFASHDGAYLGEVGRPVVVSPLHLAERRVHLARVVRLAGAGAGGEVRQLGEGHVHLHRHPLHGDRPHSAGPRGVGAAIQQRERGARIGVGDDLRGPNSLARDQLDALPRQDPGDRHAGRDDRPGLPRDVAQQKRHHSHPALDVAPDARQSVHPARGVVVEWDAVAALPA